MVTIKERLSPVDRAWLRMEHDRSPMTILGVLELDAPMTAEAVRVILTERLLVHPRFSMRFVRSRLGRFDLVPQDGFDLARHVRSIPAPADDAGYRAMLGELAGGMISRDAPPWEILVIEDLDGRSVLLPRLHHSLADGISLIQVLVSLCDEPPEHRPPPSAAATGGGIVSRVVGIVWEALRLAALPIDPPTSLKAPLTGRKRTAWTRPVPLDHLRTAAAEHGATVNDIVLGALSGALGRILASRDEGGVAALRAMVPFNLRTPEAGQPLGNRFGLVLPELPVGTPLASRRLERVNAMMSRLKSRSQGAAAYTVLNVMGVTAAVVERALLWFFGRKSSLVMTNVPGPREPLHFGGRAIDRIMFWVPQAGGIAIGVSVISYAGTVTVGVLADDGSLPDPEELVIAYEDELAGYGVDLG